MSKHKSSHRLLDQTGPFADWKEAAERFEEMMETWLDDSFESMPHANMLLARRMQSFAIRLNRTVDLRREKRR